MTDPEDRRAAERGFALIEALVAFLIAAMTVAAVMRATTTAIVSSHAAGRYDEAVARAESHLASLSAARLVASDRQGDEGDGYHWRVRVAAAAHAESQLKAVPAGPVTLYHVTVTISWRYGDGRRAVQLDSARLSPVG